MKPQFFKNEELFELEIRLKMPVRVAFAGLWCAADRNGVAKDRPRRLKAEILPYDENVEFDRLLQALHEAGLITRYTVGDVDYLHIHTFSTHQIINNREKSTEWPLPSVPEAVIRGERRKRRVVDASSTRDQSCKAEGKGREGKKNDVASGAAVATSARFDAKEHFEAFWGVYPPRNGRRRGKADAWDSYRTVVRSPETAGQVLRAARCYARHTGDGPRDTPPKDAHRWLVKDRWREWLEEADGKSREDDCRAPTAEELAEVERIRAKMLGTARGVPEGEPERNADGGAAAR